MQESDGKLLALNFLEKNRCDKIIESDGKPRRYAIMEQFTEKKPYGWIFYYNSARFVETNDLMEALAGNGPVVVLHNGEVVALGSAYAPEVEIQMFERSRGIKSSS